MDSDIDFVGQMLDLYSNCRKLFIIENTSRRINFTTASLPPTDDGFQTLYRIIRDDLQLNGEVLLFSKNGTELHPEDFYHIGNNDIVYVRDKENGAKFCYKTMLSMYKNIKKLGEGGYGTVFLFQHKISGEKVAAKFMNVSEYLRKANEIQKALKESTSLISLDHDQIINFETAFLLNEEIVLFTEYMPGGELGKYVMRTTITESDAKQIFILILEAVNYCHNHGIIHRDLKMENILLRDKDDPLSLQIIDFGIAGIWSMYGGEISTAGTLYYTPPEVIDESDLQSDPKIDVWALGVILYIILVKRYPFQGIAGVSDTRKLILESELNFKSKAEVNLSKEVKHLISMLLTKDKTQRYSLREIVSHPWIADEIENQENKTPLNSLKSSLITEAITEEIVSLHYPTLPENTKFLNVIEKQGRAVSKNRQRSPGQSRNEIGGHKSPRKLSPLKLDHTLNKLNQDDSNKQGLHKTIRNNIEINKNHNYMTTRKKRGKKMHLNSKQSKTLCKPKKNESSDHSCLYEINENNISQRRENIQKLSHFNDSSDEKNADYMNSNISSNKKRKLRMKEPGFLKRIDSMVERQNANLNPHVSVERGAYAERRPKRSSFIRSNSIMKQSLDRMDNKSIVSQPRNMTESSPFNSVGKGRQIVGDMKKLKLTKNKSSFTELPAIENTELSYKNSNFKLSEKNRYQLKRTEYANADLFFIKENFLKFINIKEPKTDKGSIRVKSTNRKGPSGSFSIKKNFVKPKASKNSIKSFSTTNDTDGIYRFNQSNSKIGQIQMK